MHDGLFQHRGGQSPAGEVLLATVLDEAPGDVVLCQNSAQPASTKELRLSKSGETLAHEQVTRRPPTLDCGSTFERAAGR